MPKKVFNFYSLHQAVDGWKVSSHGLPQKKEQFLFYILRKVA